DTVGVRELTVQDDAVLGLGQVLSHHADGDGVVPPSRVLGVMLAPPGDPLSAQASERGVGGAKAPDDLERIAARETPREIGLVELVAEDAAWLGAPEPIQRLVEISEHARERMEHEVT